MPKKLPKFSLETSGGEQISNADLRGRRAILYFYPKDDTSGCTLEAHEFTKLLNKFDKAGVVVFGVSPDSVASHDKFVSKCDIGFPLISDPEKMLCSALDVWKEKSMYGRTYMGVERSTFLVGPDGTVEREWRKVKAAGHAAEVLTAVSA